MGGSPQLVALPGTSCLSWGRLSGHCFVPALVQAVAGRWPSLLLPPAGHRGDSAGPPASGPMSPAAPGTSRSAAPSPCRASGCGGARGPVGMGWRRCQAGGQQPRGPAGCHCLVAAEGLGPWGCAGHGRGLAEIGPRGGWHARARLPTAMVSCARSREAAQRDVTKGTGRSCSFTRVTRAQGWCRTWLGVRSGCSMGCSHHLPPTPPGAPLAKEWPGTQRRGQAAGTALKALTPGSTGAINHEVFLVMHMDPAWIRFPFPYGCAVSLPGCSIA